MIEADGTIAFGRRHASAAPRKFLIPKNPAYNHYDDIQPHRRMASKTIQHKTKAIAIHTGPRGRNRGGFPSSNSASR